MLLQNQNIFLIEFAKCFVFYYLVKNFNILNFSSFCTKTFLLNCLQVIKFIKTTQPSIKYQLFFCY